MSEKISKETSNRNVLLKKSLFIFYKNKENLMKVVNVINKKTKYSLRILEWFCGNYSKKHDINYKLSNGKGMFNVYLSYKSRLDSYQKKQFDPFKRAHKGYEKFNIKYNKDESLETTVCQLNFFKWCIENEILEYVDKNIQKIKDHMNSVIIKNSIKTPKKEVDKKKRQPLSLAATRTCVKRYTNVTLNFN
jgi:basic membrane lipoprotein Med (substrate-binding protein (PBP1-ABC) superfamily)